MSLPRLQFKSCLAPLAAAILAAGCAHSDPNPKGFTATLRMHVEVTPDRSKQQETISVYRARPMEVVVERNSFLDERQLEKASVVDDLGGFVIKLEFDDTGRRLLEQYTVSRRGRHCAVFVQWGDKNPQFRWLSAPVLARVINDGVFIFTPDASRAEAEDIVRGLNNAAREYHK